MSFQICSYFVRLTINFGRGKYLGIKKSIDINQPDERCVFSVEGIFDNSMIDALQPRAGDLDDRTPRGV